MKILTAEAGDHLKILEQISRATSAYCSMDFLIIDSSVKSIDALFPSHKHLKLYRSKNKGILFFIKLALLAPKYDYVYISTGPDGSHFTEFFRVVTFWIFTYFFGFKTIITLRNLPQYTEENSNILNKIRNRAIRSISRFTFETKGMEKEFKTLNLVPDAKTAVSYDRYPDIGKLIYAEALPKPLKYKKIKNSFTIGLLGTVNPERRNYHRLIAALKKLELEKRRDIQIILMGAILNEQSSAIISSIRNYVNVHIEENTISEYDFVRLGLNCKVLIAPLNEKKEYGTLFGTGSIGDAIYLKRKILIPSFFDKNKEFKDLSIYYETSNDLANQIENCMADHSFLEPKHSFDRFHSKNVIKKLCQSLNLR